MSTEALFPMASSARHKLVTVYVGRCQLPTLSHSEAFHIAYLVLGVEIKTLLSIERNVSQEAGLVARPRELRERNRDWHIDTDLSHVDLALKLASGGTRLSENGSPITVLVGVYD